MPDWLWVGGWGMSAVEIAAQVRVVPGPHRTRVSNKSSRANRERCATHLGSEIPGLRFHCDDPAGGCGPGLTRSFTGLVPSP